MASGEPDRESGITSQLESAKTRLMWFRAAHPVHQGAAYLTAGLTLVSFVVVSRFVALSLMDWVWIMAAAMVVGIPALWVVAGVVGWLVRPNREQLDLIAAESRRTTLIRPRGVRAGTEIGNPR